MKTLPSILDYIDPTDIKRLRFIRPTVGQDLTMILQQDTKHSLAATDMTVSKLRIQSDTVIPFHCNRGEQVLIHGGECHVDVLILFDDDVKKFELIAKDHLLVIPPCAPVAMRFYGIVHGMHPDITIIGSGLRSDHVEMIWEEATERLLLNEHLKKEA